MPVAQLACRRRLTPPLCRSLLPAAGYAAAWWAAGGRRRPSPLVNDPETTASGVERPSETVAASIALTLGRPGLCERLRAFTLCCMAPDLGAGQYSTLLMLLARVAPELSFLSLQHMGSVNDVPTFTASMRALGQLRHLQHLYIDPPVADVSCLFFPTCAPCTLGGRRPGGPASSALCTPCPPSAPSSFTQIAPASPGGTCPALCIWTLPPSVASCLSSSHRLPHH